MADEQEGYGKPPSPADVALDDRAVKDDQSAR